MIDTSKWMTYYVDELFAIRSGDEISDDNYSEEKDEEYRFPIITEDGVIGYCSYYNCEGKCIVAPVDENVLYATYQPGPCWVDKFMNMYKYKYKPSGFVMKPLHEMFFAHMLRVNRTTIKLPRAKNGYPDMDKIEKCTREIVTELVTDIVNNRKKIREVLEREELDGN